jgi:thioredoxin 1
MDYTPFSDMNIQDSPLTLLCFSASWCGPCRVLSPVLDEIASEFSDVATVAKIDIDADYEAATTYGIRSVPTMIVFKNGEESGRVLGAVGKEKILAALGVE